MRIILIVAITIILAIAALAGSLFYSYNSSVAYCKNYAEQLSKTYESKGSDYVDSVKVGIHERCMKDRFWNP